MIIVGFKCTSKKGRNIVKDYHYTSAHLWRDLSSAVITYNMLNGTNAFAQSNNPTMEALKPIIRLMQDFAEPAAYAGYVISGMQLLTGNQHKAIKTAKYTTLGFLAVHFAPVFLTSVRQAARGIGTGGY